MEKIKLSKKKIKIIISIIIFTIIIIYLISILTTTGFLQASKIDEKDLSTWEYEDGKIKNTDEFSILGKTETCWILINSYTATVSEMRPLAQVINSELGDFVFVAKLSGHGEVPSHLEGKNLDIWYKEVESRYRTLNNSLCDNFNVVGSSLGSVIALRLAEEHELKRVYVLNPFISKKYEFYKILPFETRTKLFSGILNYKKKSIIGEINSPEGRAAHISYWNLPYEPIKDSLPFIEQTRENLNKINETVFIAYSENDAVTGEHSAQIIINGLTNTKSKIALNYKNSNHILLMDNDRIAVMHDIIVYEKQNR